MEAVELTWPRPIPVGESLPETGVAILAFSGAWRSAVWNGEKWFDACVFFSPYDYEENEYIGEWRVSPSHWLPLPPAP